MGSPGIDLAIVGIGALGTVLAVMMALVSWITSRFEFQSCVVRNVTGVS
jgi:hypothetical protein